MTIIITSYPSIWILSWMCAIGEDKKMGGPLILNDLRKSAENMMCWHYRSTVSFSPTLQLYNNFCKWGKSPPWILKWTEVARGWDSQLHPVGEGELKMRPIYEMRQENHCCIRAKAWCTPSALQIIFWSTAKYLQSHKPESQKGRGSGGMHDEVRFWLKASFRPWGNRRSSYWVLKE